MVILGNNQEYAFLVAWCWSLKTSFIKICDQFWTDLLNIHFYEMVETLLSDVFFKQTSLKIDGPRKSSFIVSSYSLKEFSENEPWNYWASRKTRAAPRITFLVEKSKLSVHFSRHFSYFGFVVYSNCVWFSWWRIIIMTRVALDNYLHRYRNAKACNNLFIWLTSF